MIDEVVRWPRRNRPDAPVLVLGHRGGEGPWRENTLAAFAGALAGGADGVELDVRRTADGRLVIHHDAEIEGVGAIHGLRADTLPDWVPGLDEALEVCAGAVVNVEVKNLPTEAGFDPDETVAGEVVAALGRARGRGPAAVIVSSFWPASLAAVAAADPTVATGLLVHPSVEPRQMLEQAGAIGCVALHPFHSATDGGLVEEIHRRGMAVVTWTVNEPAEVAGLAAAGVDGVISYRVGISLRALRRG
jgi:glycerophosphoryl diester phosphodiesterase